MGLIQVRAAADKVAKIIRKWGKDTGATFSVGDMKFGPKPGKKTVDKLEALTMMVDAELSLADIARAVNASESSLSKIKDEALKKQIIDECVDPTGGRPSWGR